MKFIFEIIEIKYRIEKYRLENGAKFDDFLKKLWQKKLSFAKNLIADNFNKKLVILAIILLSILWRSSLDIGSLSAYNLFDDLKITNNSEILGYNNLKLLKLLAISCNFFANIFAINPIFLAEITINFIGVISLIFCNHILKNTDNITKNLLLILLAITYFLPFENLQKNDFFTDLSIILALIFPVIAYLYVGQNNLTILEKFIFALILAILILQNIYFLILIPILNYDFFINPKKNYQNICLQILVLFALAIDLAIIKYFLNLWFAKNNLSFVDLLKIYQNSFLSNFYNSFESLKIIGFHKLYYDFLAFILIYLLAFWAFFWVNLASFNKNILALICSLILVYFAQNFDNKIAILLQSLMIISIILNLKFYHQNIVKKFYKYWFLFFIFFISSLYSHDFKMLAIHLIFWSLPLIFLIVFFNNFRHKILFYENFFISIFIVISSIFCFFLEIIEMKLFFISTFLVGIWTVYYLTKIIDINERLKKLFHFVLALILVFALSDIFRNYLIGVGIIGGSNQNNQALAQNIFQKTNLAKNSNEQILQISPNFKDLFPSTNYFPKNINNLQLNILNNSDIILINNLQIQQSWFTILRKYQSNFLSNFIDNFVKEIQNPQQKFIIFFNNDICNIGLVEFLLRDEKFKENFLKNFQYYDNYSSIFVNDTFKTKPLQENLSNQEFELITQIHNIKSEFWQMPKFEIFIKNN